MSGNDVQRGRRALAEIESDLLKAGEAFAEADTRLKEAECDRLAAIESIDKCQMEFDEAVAELRQGSIPGTKWHPEIQETADILILQPENVAADGTVSDRSSPTSAASDDPVLKVKRPARA